MYFFQEQVSSKAGSTLEALNLEPEGVAQHWRSTAFCCPDRRTADCGMPGARKH
jgi:hypothetical protein